MSHVPCPWREVTRDQFAAYERVRRGGLYNMYTGAAFEASGLPREVYLAVLCNYAEISHRYPEVRDEREE